MPRSLSLLKKKNEHKIQNFMKNIRDVNVHSSLVDCRSGAYVCPLRDRSAVNDVRQTGRPQKELITIMWSLFKTILK